MNALRLLILSFVLAVSASAQQLDNPLTIPVQFYGQAMNNPPSAPGVPATFSISVNGTSNTGSRVGSDMQVFYSAANSTANLTPGKVYTVVVSSYQCAYVVAWFVPVNGCQIYINGRKTQSIGNGGTYSFTLRVEIGDTPIDAGGVVSSRYPPSVSPTAAARSAFIPDDISATVLGKRGGHPSSIAENRPVWYISLGKLRNGSSAGALGIRQATMDASLGNTSSLIYDSVDTSEVTVTRTGGYITKIIARDVWVDVSPYSASSTSYTVKVYQNVSPAPTAPYITYRVAYETISGGTALRIDKLEGKHQWTTKLEKVGSKWTRWDWQRLSTTTTTIDTSLTLDSGGPKATTTVSGTYPATTEVVDYGQCNADDTSVKLKKTKTYIAVNGKQELSSVTAGNSQTTSYTYYTSSTGGGWVGAIESITDPTGGWTKYEYYNGTASSGAGMVKAIYRPFKDSPSAYTGASDTAGVKEAYTYTTNYDGTNTAMASKITTVNGTVAGKTTWSYNWNAGTVNGYQYGTQTQNDFSSASSSLATVTKAYLPNVTNSFLAGKPHSVTYPDGQRESYAYISGTWNSATNTFTGAPTGHDRLILVFRGHSTNAFGGAQALSWTVGGVAWTLDPVYLIPDKSVISETVVNDRGQVVFKGEIVVGTTVTERVAGMQMSYNANNLLASEKDIFRSIGTNEVKSSYTYAGGLSNISTGIDGVQTDVNWTSFLQLKKIITAVDGPSSYPEKEQEFTYYPSGLRKTEQDCSCSPVVKTYYYDGGGRITKTKEPAPQEPAGTLETTVAYSSTGRTVTETFPTGATRATVTFLDGRVKRVTGTAVVDKYIDYSVNTTSGVLVKKTTNGSTDANGWVEETYDWLGRVIKTRTPQVGWSSSNATKVTAIVTAYNSAGQVSSVATLDEGNSNAALLPKRFLTWGALGALVKEGYDVDGSGSITDASMDRVFTYSTTIEKETGSYLGWNKIEKSYLLAGNNSATKTLISERRTRLTKFNNGALDGAWICISAMADYDASGWRYREYEWVNPVTKERRKTSKRDGISNQSEAIWSYGYLKSEKSISGVTKTYTYNSVGLLASETEGATGATTSYTYYPSTKHVKTTTRKTVSSSTTTDTFTYTWNTSAKTLTVLKTDDGGRKVWAAYNAQGLPWRMWGGGTLPSQTTYDSYGRRTNLTTWTSNSNWNDETWPSSPGSGNTTTWTIDAATGTVTGKSYPNGDTLSYVFNARGQIKKRTNGRGMVTNYRYFEDTSLLTGELKDVDYATTTGLPVTTDLAFTYTRFGALKTVTDASGTRTFTYRSDLKPATETLGSSYSNKVITYNYDTYGRPTGYSYAGSATVSQVTTYDAATGRVSTLAGTHGSTTATFTLGYHSGTDFVKTYTSGSYVRETTLESQMKMYKSVANKWGGTSLGTFTAGFDASRELQNQLTSGSTASNSWSKLLGLGDGIKQTFGYDSKGQLNSAAQPTWTGTAGTESLSARAFGWAYDNQGNRTSQTLTQATTYARNGSNQYTSLTEGAVTTTLGYDSDGNLSSDGTWTYTYDHENRLQKMEDATQVITYAYDYMGRRISKIVTNPSTGATISGDRFVWASWHQIADTSTGGTVRRAYLWGPDLSDRRGAAGGAGGLLAQLNGTELYYAMADQHGNVVGYIKNSTGTITAAREFGPFGQTLDQYGSVDSFPFWYSSKYHDSETGLVYYGLRYYQPKMGRFINRDPVEELGGNNLYAFCRNRGVGGWDVLGLNDDPIVLPPLEVNGGRGGGAFYLWFTRPRLLDGGRFRLTIKFNEGAGKADVEDPQEDPNNKQLSKSDCDSLASKIANNVATLDRIASTQGENLNGGAVNSLRSMWNAVGYPAELTGYAEGIYENGYRMAKTLLDASGNSSWRKSITGAYKSAAPTVKVVGGVLTAMDVVQLGVDINDRDGLMFISHSAEMGLGLMQLTPGMNLVVMGSRYAIRDQLGKLQGDVDRMDATSAAAYNQEMSRNVVTGTRNVNQWQKEWNDGGCARFNK